MKNKLVYLLLLVAILSALFDRSKNLSKQGETQKLKSLIINGQNNHNWKVGSETLKQILEGSELFVVHVATSPEKGADMSNFKPRFSAYDIIVLEYNGDEWCDEAKSTFISYVKKGGGVFVMHAADNSFPDWKEFNEMIGVGGWGKRNEKDGPYVYIDDNGNLR